jgi:glycosyltransferase involved in cell wall biosynthesis
MSYIVDHERTGLLSIPGDAAALAHNILRVLSDSDLATRLAQNARAESVRYHWESVREQWLKVYLSLAPHRRKPEQALAGVV